MGVGLFRSFSISTISYLLLLFIYQPSHKHYDISKETHFSVRLILQTIYYYTRKCGPKIRGFKSREGYNGARTVVM